MVAADIFKYVVVAFDVEVADIVDVVVVAFDVDVVDDDIKWIYE